MAHFAEINKEGIVQRVIVADQAFIDTGSMGDPANWLQTSYNTRRGIHYGSDGQPDGGTQLRKNYAGQGFTYDKSRDAFIPPQPYPSWVFNEDACSWDPPIPQPDAPAWWNEDTKSWDLLNI